MKLPTVLSEGFLRALPAEERKKLRPRAHMTAVEVCATFKRGKEIELQRLCMNWLLLHDIYFEWDRTDKRTSRKKGRADFRICFKGRKKRRRRVICLYLAEHNVIVLATLYKKSKRETLMEDEKRSLKQAAHTIKARFKLG